MPLRDMFAKTRSEMVALGHITTTPPTPREQAPRESFAVSLGSRLSRKDHGGPVLGCTPGRTACQV